MEPDIKELRITLRLDYDYTAKEVRKMTDKEVLDIYLIHRSKEIIEGQ